MADPVGLLQQPVTFPFSGRTAKNRFLKSAMSERLATFSTFYPSGRGRPTEELVRLYETWAKGDIGIIVTGNIQIKKDHLEATGRNTIIDRDLPSNYPEDWAEVARAAKSEGSLVIGQLNHPGRQVSINIQPYPEAPSDVEHPSTGGVLYGRPTPLTTAGINDIVQRFAYVAFVLHKAGFDGIQLHAAHGYLLSQFLAKSTNMRKDEYGGSLINRTRILLEIIEAIKQAVQNPCFIISVKLNSQDFTQEGINVEESIMVAELLENAGVDFIEVSGGTYAQTILNPRDKPYSVETREGYFIQFAELLRPHLKFSKIVVTGGFRTVYGMSDAVFQGATDMIGLARPLTAEPHLVRDILRGEKNKVKDDKFPDSPLLRFVASAAQIAEIGNGQDITNFDNAFNVARFIAIMQKEIPATISEALF
ncbi:FMN-linked oxidoreductase [Rhizopogon vinicolor AM-OR11-026]|uniref:FMN-linked oxidoreductase n=1 Tax=Rhizopogon vinicolor AM-OR11-026 TaxID=1314800 RepID=A0A1B7MYS7_9AGAM|nr:FMN-linked oxidoreductase [Rhizopogon vinicolor AM-OR11-026]